MKTWKHSYTSLLFHSFSIPLISNLSYRFQIPSVMLVWLREVPVHALCPFSSPLKTAASLCIENLPLYFTQLWILAQSLGIKIEKLTIISFNSFFCLNLLYNSPPEVSVPCIHLNCSSDSYKLPSESTCFMFKWIWLLSLSLWWNSSPYSLPENWL